MTDAEKAAQIVFPGHKFGIDSVEEAELLVELGVGGFCLYGGRPQEVAEFTARLQSKAKRPLLMSGDYEDGVAQQCPGATSLPSNMGIGASGSEQLAEEKGRITAIEARALGVPWVLAPVCDLATAPANPIVNTRAFGDNPALVARLGAAYLRGLRAEGAIGCLKHFPGHGDTTADSHLELPSVDADRATLDARELAPFQALASTSESVMTAHLKVPALVPEGIPYSISADPNKTLRGTLGFQGLISTDALAMQAIAANFDELEASRMALLGGADILLVPTDARGLVRRLGPAVEDSPELVAIVRAAYERLEAARAKVRSGPRPPLELVGGAKHRETAERMAESCLAWAGAPVKLPANIRYWEPESDPDEWFGATFIDMLREFGLKVEPWTPGEPPPAGERLVVGTFLNPRAYTGRIAYDEDERAEIRGRLRAVPNALVVSFGSPFVFDDLETPGLCAFGKNEASQRVAALALTGKIEVHGRMPVRLKIAARA